MLIIRHTKHGRRRWVFDYFNFRYHQILLADDLHDELEADETVSILTRRFWKKSALRGQAAILRYIFNIPLHLIMPIQLLNAVTSLQVLNGIRL